MKISLVTTSFNSASTIRDTFDSVLRQTYPHIEYIVIDGGSKDGTIDIIKEYEILFGDKMKWISEKDAGLYDAMNKGIRMATGDIVGIINSDDFYCDNNVIAIVANSFTDDIEAVYGDVKFVSPGNLNKTVRYYSSKKFSPKLFRFGFMPAHPTFFTYKKYFDQMGYYSTDYKIASDYELLIRFLYVNKLKSKYISLPFMKMRTGGISTASVNSNVVLNKEIVTACKSNGIYTNMGLLLLKYVVKIWEFILVKR